uniref:Uncharacterized protein n=1 Tax=Lepeophtheirus salmonis TaxID=72036 RepID=A0A0K2TQS5_LEPSM
MDEIYVVRILPSSFSMKKRKKCSKHCTSLLLDVLVNLKKNGRDRYSDEKSCPSILWYPCQRKLHEHYYFSPPNISSNC